MPEERSLTYHELVAKVEILEAQLNEMMRTTVRINREPLSEMPSALESGSIALFDDGTDAAICVQTSDGLKSAALTT